MFSLKNYIILKIIYLYYLTDPNGAKYSHGSPSHIYFSIDPCLNIVWFVDEAIIQVYIFKCIWALKNRKNITVDRLLFKIALHRLLMKTL